MGVTLDSLQLVVDVLEESRELPHLGHGGAYYSRTRKKREDYNFRIPEYDEVRRLVKEKEIHLFFVTHHNCSG